eukprot:TRINITY_DN506_c0_g1_i3.p1 TRINITY_DN506_c0_g1~~TRINITY_DN506_c0_g1_i3.p1  ORF type:complete len:113 (-),score=16.71 TRINITY_DN506_c0_g1_i3:66-404(-)
MLSTKYILITLFALVCLLNTVSAKGSFYSGRRSARYGYYGYYDVNSYDMYSRHVRYRQQQAAIYGDNNTAIYGAYYSAGTTHLPAVSLLLSFVTLISLLFLRLNGNRKEKSE